MFEGILLGLVSFASLFMSWQHLPKRLKEWSKRFPLVSDILAGLIVFKLLTGFSKSLVAVIGAVTSTILVNFSFLGVKLYKQSVAKD